MAFEENSSIEISLANFDALAAAYRPLLLTSAIAVHGQNPAMEFDDLHQEGLVALWDAIRLFDPERGIFFGHYLKTAILNKMRAKARDYLPHHYAKDPAKSTSTKTAFRRVSVSVSGLDDLPPGRY